MCIVPRCLWVTHHLPHLPAYRHALYLAQAQRLVSRTPCDGLRPRPHTLSLSLPWCHAVLQERRASLAAGGRGRDDLLQALLTVGEGGGVGAAVCACAAVGSTVHMRVCMCVLCVRACVRAERLFLRLCCRLRVLGWTSAPKFRCFPVCSPSKDMHVCSDSARFLPLPHAQDRTRIHIYAR